MFFPHFCIPFLQCLLVPVEWYDRTQDGFNEWVYSTIEQRFEAWDEGRASLLDKEVLIALSNVPCVRRAMQKLIGETFLGDRITPSLVPKKRLYTNLVAHLPLQAYEVFVGVHSQQSKAAVLNFMNRATFSREYLGSYKRVDQVFDFSELMRSRFSGVMSDNSVYGEQRFIHRCKWITRLEAHRREEQRKAKKEGETPHSSLLQGASPTERDLLVKDAKALFYELLSAARYLFVRCIPTDRQEYIRYMKTYIQLMIEVLHDPTSSLRTDRSYPFVLDVIIRATDYAIPTPEYLGVWLAYYTKSKYRTPEDQHRIAALNISSYAHYQWPETERARKRSLRALHLILCRRPCLPLEVLYIVSTYLGLQFSVEGRA